ncbi:unnamed protein product [Ilex paraguariensis]|uniref:Uncharacterized protein n=1 Tax=Ilex paraguariensis TaxID=185542 RepID=A0ABC8UA11_9AQUA
MPLTRSARELGIGRRFFKIMLPGFHTLLVCFPILRHQLVTPSFSAIPPAFCRRLRGERLEEAILTSCKGSWHVKVGKCDKGRFYFEKGWDEFVQNHNLNVGDFLVFEQKGQMFFNVVVFDRSACEKEFTVELAKDKKQTSKVNIDKPLNCSDGVTMKEDESKAKNTKTQSKFCGKRTTSESETARRSPAKKEKTMKNQEKPKKPLSAFVFFLDDYRKQFKEIHPKKTPLVVVTKAGADKWYSMSEDDKAPYRAKVEKMRSEYRERIFAGIQKAAKIEEPEEFFELSSGDDE